MVDVQNAELQERIKAVLTGWGGVGIMYLIAGILQGEGYLIHENQWEQKIPFNLSWLWFYLSFFIFIPLCFLLVDFHRLKTLKYIFLVNGLISASIFLLYPTTIHYPEVAKNSLNEQIWHLLIANDPQNCVPSLHASQTFIGMVLLYDNRRKMQSVFISIWAIAILISIIAVRRHLLLDIFSGILLGVICIAVVQMVINKLSGMNLLTTLAGYYVRIKHYSLTNKRKID